MQTEVAKTLEDLGVSPRWPGGKRLGAVLQMLLRFPHVILQDWRSMFLVPDDFLLEPLSAIWNTPTPLRDKIFAYALQQPGQPLPSLDWMAETLCDAIRSRVGWADGRNGRLPDAFPLPSSSWLPGSSHVTGPAARWYEKELAQAVAAGITDVTRPDDYCTRAEAAVMVLRALGKR